MSILAMLAERLMQEAVDRGDLDNLPGAGKPLDLSVDAFTPPALRMAYKVLKDANYMPEEVVLMKEVADLRAKIKDLAAKTPEAPELPAMRKELVFKEAQMNTKIEGFRRLYGG